jgi:hypothetical protein
VADWPSPHHHEPHPLPRIEDLPSAREGYDRERVQAAFDAFYRHIAQLDATLRTLESVEAFRSQAGDLRAELRSLRSAGWAPYPRGYAFTPERSMLGSVPEAVPRIALEVVFLVVVAAVVAVAKFSALEIVAVMAGAVVITFLVELIASRERRAPTPMPAAVTAPPLPVEALRPPPAPQPAPVAQQRGGPVERAQTETDELSPPPAEPEGKEPAPVDDVGGWAAFAEPVGPQPLTLMGALAGEEEQEAAKDEEKPEAEPERVEREPVAEREEPAPAGGEAETGTTPRSRRFRRRRDREEQPPAPQEPEPSAAAAPKHVRVLPASETAVAEAELPPWERGFDDTEERRP